MQPSGLRMTLAGYILEKIRLAVYVYTFTCSGPARSKIHHPQAKVGPVHW